MKELWRSLWDEDQPETAAGEYQAMGTFDGYEAGRGYEECANQAEPKEWQGYGEADQAEAPVEWRGYDESPGLAAEEAADADIGRLRAKAVRQAWANEADLVREGKGSRDWTVGQQAELLKYGRVTGFEGSHMMNAHDYPEYAGDPDNIQFLPSIAHFEGVHEGNPRGVNPNGWYDEDTGEVMPAEDGRLPERRIIELTDRYDPTQAEYHDATPDMDQSGDRRHDEYYASKRNHPEKSSDRKFGQEQAADESGRNRSSAEPAPLESERVGVSQSKDQGRSPGDAGEPGEGRDNAQESLEDHAITM